LASAHGAVDLIENLADGRPGKALTPGDRCSRSNLTGPQLTQPFDGALARIEPLTGAAHDAKDWPM
jgi:hypothetical protein